MTSPGSIADLELWLKADAITPIADGAALVSWPDSSGNGYSAVALSNQPHYQLNIINSLPVVRFAGDPEFMTVASVASLQVTSFSIFVVAAPAAGGTGPIFNYCAGDDSTDFGRGYGAQMDETTVGVKKGSGDTSEEIISVARVDPGTGFTWFDGHYTDTSLLKAYDQAVGSTTTPDTSGISYTNVVGLLIGKQLARAAFTTWFEGDIAEIIIYSRELTDAEKDGVRDYLNEKYFPALVQTERRILALDVNDENGNTMYTTSWENGTLFLRRWSADRDLLQKTNVGTATAAEIAARTYWIFPHTPGYFTVVSFGSYVYVAGRWDDGAVKHLARSTNGGATFTNIGDAAWTTERVGALWTTDENTIYVILNGSGEIWRTTNAGVAWTMINSAVPFDVEHQALSRHPDGRVLISGNVGGSPAAAYLESPYTGAFVDATNADLSVVGGKPAAIWIV